MATTEAKAETTKPATTRTRPSRSRADNKPAETAATPTAIPAEDRTVIVLEPVGITKTYSKWQAPEGTGCAGNFYAPLGVTSVRVAYTK